MRHRFSPSFVVTVSALTAACSKPAPKESAEPVTKEMAKETDASKVEPIADETTTEKKATRKRKRTSVAAPTWKPTSGAVDYADLIPLNPHDEAGRTVFVSMDDLCYVQLPPKSPPKNVPPGVPYYEAKFLDCPSELDDPAWDQCPGGLVEAVKGKADCYCVHLGGNPPPPPSMNACPKSAPKAGTK